MKKIYLTICFLFAVSFAFCQQTKYLFLYGVGAGYDLYISDVIDVTTLPVSGVSRNGAYGKKTLMKYYEEVADQWFTNQIKKTGYQPKPGSVVAIIKVTWAEDGYDPGCPTGNENPCFCLTKEECAQERQKYMNAEKGSNFIFIH